MAEPTAEPTGLEILTALLKAIKGDKPVDADRPETHSEPGTVPCRVPGCDGPAVFRCSFGWRYCAGHALSPRLRGARHSYELMLDSPTADIRMAEIELERRFAVHDYEDAN